MIYHTHSLRYAPMAGASNETTDPPVPDPPFRGLFLKLIPLHSPQERE